MNLFLGATTDSGKRANNEDFHSASTGEDLGIAVDALLVVADGMGGRNFGEHASETAVDVVKATLVEQLRLDEVDHAKIKAAIQLALQTANDNVYELSQRDSESEGMGTTCVVAVIAQGRLHLGHAGDSRAYVVHHGRLELLTDDHSFVAEQVRAGILTEENARKSKFRNVITRAVGIEPTIAPDIAEYPAEEIDAVLLCSDGLTNMVSDKNIQKVILTAATPQIAADKLVRMAKTAGGSDNITAVVARLADGPIVEPSTTEDDEPDEMPVAVDSALDAGPQPSRAPLTVISILFALVLLFSLYAGSQLLHDGYNFQATPPFVVKPPAPKPPPPLDLTTVNYAAPRKLYPYPVLPEPLALSTASKSITVMSATGDIVRLSMDGAALYKFPQPGKTVYATGFRPVDAVHAPAPYHYATDSQGDVYMADAAARIIYKIRPSGEPVASVAVGLTKPESIAIDDIGNIYVIDGTALKIIPAVPSQ